MALTKVTSGGISDIAAAVEGASDSNKFTDADHSKLNAIEASATADQTKSDIEGLGIDVPAANLTGTIPDARFPATLPAASATNLTAIPAANLTGTLPAISGANLTGISSVGGATGVDFNDNTKARFGTGNDLEIYHDGTHSYIKDVGTGDLRIKGTELSLRSDSQDEPYINCTENGAVKLYYNNVSTLETMDGGVKVANNGTFQNYNVAEASTNIAGSAKTITISGLHTLSPGNHWDRASIWMWLTGTSGDYNHTTSKHWRHECQVIGPWSLGSAVEVYGGTPPTTATVTSGSNNSTLQFTVTQSAGNAALRVMVFGYSLSSNCKITFS